MNYEKTKAYFEIYTNVYTPIRSSTDTFDQLVIGTGRVVPKVHTSVYDVVWENIQRNVGRLIQDEMENGV